MITKFLRRKGTPALPPQPINLRPILARALGKDVSDTLPPEVQRLLHLIGDGRTEKPAE